MFALLLFFESLSSLTCKGSVTCLPSDTLRSRTVAEARADASCASAQSCQVTTGGNHYSSFLSHVETWPFNLAPSPVTASTILSFYQNIALQCVRTAQHVLLLHMRDTQYVRRRHRKMRHRLFSHSTAFTSALKGYEHVVAQCANCGNVSARVFKRW